MGNSTAILKDYYQLTKPGIIRGNIMTAIAGYFLASAGKYNFSLLLWLVVGVSFIIASACVFNNYIDRDIDKHMERTKNRALVTSRIVTTHALIYATMLSVIGFIFLYRYTNTLTVLIGVVGIFSYVVVYGYFKRRSVHGTLIGSVSGATALVAGYCSVGGRFNVTALLLFVVMSVWQMPHFFAIGIYRKQDYSDANLPILPVIRGIPATKKQNVIYICLFIIATILLTIIGATGYAYATVITITGLWWLRIAVNGLHSKNDLKYGHQIFGFSLVALLIFSVMISITNYLP